MSPEDIQLLIEQLVTGEVSSQDHEALQQILKTDPDARSLFRERMDLETSLRTWASEPKPEHDARPSPERKNLMDLESRRAWGRSDYAKLAMFAAAAAILVVVGMQILNLIGPTTPNQLAQGNTAGAETDRQPEPEFVGRILQQADCEWKVQPVSASGRFATGKFDLVTGAAELVFDSGTQVTMEAPCKIAVKSIDCAQLLAGNVFVNVTELSNGFTMETPDSQIVDEGTEYAVSIGDDATEVHVFDGSVVWIPLSDEKFEDRIASGEAKSFLRSDPTRAKRIPFGQRHFVRQIETHVKRQAGKSLLAYDGFENLAGRLRRGRSGFGWSGGWEAGGRSRGKLAEIIKTPDDIVFGHSRNERRQMLLENGCDIRREFESPLELVSGDSIYISMLLQHTSTRSESDGRSFQVSLEPNLPGRGRRLHQVVSFGITTNGFPFINSGKTITKTASKMNVSEALFVVLKFAVHAGSTSSSIRVYQSGEIVDVDEPSSWTALGQSTSALARVPASLRIIAGENASWAIDELKIGASWHSVRPDSQTAQSVD